jgi:hypothetical protein
MDGMQLPYVASCFRATVAARPESTATEPSGKPAEADDVLLIDFS